MGQNFIARDRGQVMLLPPSLTDWLSEDHLVWTVLGAVEEMDLDAFYGAYRANGQGRAAYDPAMIGWIQPVVATPSVEELRCLKETVLWIVLLRQGQGGCIICIGSPHAHLPLPASMAYNMAKAAVDQMARTAAVELLPHRIRVNIVHHGWTDTPGERKYFSEEVLQRTATTLPWGRLARPEEIARGILFLVDPASDYITGSTLTIDGGIQLPWWSKRGSGEF